MTNIISPSRRKREVGFSRSKAVWKSEINFRGTDFSQKQCCKTDQTASHFELKKDRDCGPVGCLPIIYYFLSGVDLISTTLTGPESELVFARIPFVIAR